MNAPPRCALNEGNHLMKRDLTIGGLAAAVLVAGTMLSAPSAHAEERTCRGTLGAVTVDNLRVPADASCTLNGTSVKGTVKIESGGRLTATKIRVVGNIQAEGHRSVNVTSSTVGGSIQLKQGGTASIRSNRVTGDVQSFTNSGSQTISSNRINGNLQCKENVPAPTGSGNIVDGNKEDQCRTL
jgi:hypothetical protein